MPGLSGFVVTFDIEFAYTHPVSCETDSADRSCIELVVHMTPRWDATQLTSDSARRELNLPPGQNLQYWSATYQRIVTEPHTLIVHRVDTRRFWHVSYGATQPEENASQRTLLTFTYH